MGGRVARACGRAEPQLDFLAVWVLSCISPSCGTLAKTGHVALGGATLP